MPPKVADGGLNGTYLDAHKGIIADLNRTEQARQQRSNELARAWRNERRAWTVVLVEAGVIVCLAGIIGWLATSGILVVGYMTRVDAHGQEQPLESVPTKPMKVEHSVTHGVLWAWVENVRWITEDTVLFGLMWNRVQDFTTTAGMRQLDNFKRDQKQRQAKGRRVLVRVGSVLPIGTEANSWVVEWCEEARDLHGAFLREESGLYKATLRVADWQSKTAKDEMDLRRRQKNWRNTYGVFVDGINWPSPRPFPQEKDGCDSLGKP